MILTGLVKPSCVRGPVRLMLYLPVLSQVAMCRGRRIPTDDVGYNTYRISVDRRRCPSLSFIMTTSSTVKVDWSKVDNPELILQRFPSRRSVVYGTKGVVSSSQPLATEAGLEILRKGGNAGMDTYSAICSATGSPHVGRLTTTSSGCRSRNCRGVECDRTEFLRNRRVRTEMLKPSP